MRLPTGPRRYWFYFALQALGAALLVWQGVPVYREFVNANVPSIPRFVLYAWAFAGMALIHGGYWPALRMMPAVGAKRRALLGHVMMFTSRLGLVFVGAFFSVIFLIHAERLGLDWERKGMALLVVFTLFCFSRELDRLGQALNDPPGRT
jgi:hypothetical protein